MATHVYFLVWCLASAFTSATPLDDYVNAPDANYGWFNTKQTIKTISGATAYVLNVTSQKWLDTSRAAGPDGDIWTHQVIVIIPTKLLYTNVSVAYLTGNCNDNPSLPGPTDEELLLVDTISASLHCVGMIVYQLPNCPIIYPADPLKMKRSEDSMIAFAWSQFFIDKNPEWLPRLPMTKAAMACMRAVQEFTSQQHMAQIESFFVSGASKRGWTTWMVGAVTCPSCPKILGIAPIVPVAPSIMKDMHRMWQAYHGWTFAFQDYYALNLTKMMDSPDFMDLLQIVDPQYYVKSLARIPKLVVVSSDDEFMMMDWTDIWFDAFQGGETHMLIVPDSEHSMATGVFEATATLTAFAGSLMHSIPARPSFTYSRNASDGTLNVMIDTTKPPLGVNPSKVVLHTAMTLQQDRRDFRWVRLASNSSSPCISPDIPLPKPVFGGNCLQPILWTTTKLEVTEGGLYTFTPPPNTPKWMGYYIEVFFPSDIGLKDHLQTSTPGFVWPDTLPFEDCTGEACYGELM